MTDRPIIFSAPMVRALLDGRKTQTRRILKTPPAPNHLGAWEVSTIGGRGCIDGRGQPVPVLPCLWHSRNGAIVTPRYAVGDRLYVREHWKTMALHKRVPPRDLGPKYRQSIYADEAACPVLYLADGQRLGRWTDATEEASSEGWKPGAHRQAMHMPRWASRLTLIVEDVKVERLQAIGNDDARAEGVERDGTVAQCWRDYTARTAGALGPRESFASLWESLHGAESWVANPFVVGLTFRVERGNIDQLTRAA